MLSKRQVRSAGLRNGPGEGPSSIGRGRSSSWPRLRQEVLPTEIPSSHEEDISARGGDAGSMQYSPPPRPRKARRHTDGVLGSKASMQVAEQHPLAPEGKDEAIMSGIYLPGRPDILHNIDVMPDRENGYLSGYVSGYESEDDGEVFSVTGFRNLGGAAGKIVEEVQEATALLHACAYDTDNHKFAKLDH
ncbi:hypothetical protein SARC_07342 [Sphaeroforma arctica JP610]|uniref:Uncharacterized protein n=1 Tax=Sphaeroforma arctica JP610 TaxID=667725 RepID=A0A0L0FUF8_9EUKA|nr:hypothetical protein SARC_07342 [Sphaeroforma arctica JP610]KNC80294.1 hypothetical protein SARC_07342 [Sphaeroforma arctica JP610]|eukprot:XP_014154196.1 hypothetical protein SARC_07342 [Sphaeroforma arctica JP610]